MLLWVWLTAETNAPTVSAVGLIVTFFAFGLTLWQLWATRREVGRAVDEIERFKKNLQAEESVRLVAILTEQLRHAVDLVRQGRSPPIFDMLDRIRVGIARLASLRTQAGINSDALDVGARSLSDFMTANERAKGALPDPDKQAAITALRRLQSELAVVDGMMRDARK